MTIYHICDNGYKYDKRIFQGVTGILLLLIFGYAASQGFDFSYKFYFKCDQFVCDNPYSDDTAPYNSITGHKYLCKADWCKQKFLLRGEYGQREPEVVSFFPYILSFLLLSGFILNHIIHNKGKQFSIKPNIPERYWKKIKDIFRGESF